MAPTLIKPSSDKIRPTVDAEASAAASSPATAGEMRKTNLASTDNFYQDSKDIVTVFDYDRNIGRKRQLATWMLRISKIFRVVTVLSLFFILGSAGHIIALGIFAGSLVLSCACLPCAYHPTPDKHTAITATGIRHAIEPDCFFYGPGKGGDFDIPFHDITKVDIAVPRIGSPTVLVMGTASAVIPFVASCGTRYDIRQGSAFVVDITGLKEPCVFKQFVECKLIALAEQPTTTPSNPVEVEVSSTTV